MRRFVTTIFRRCAGRSGWITLRAFEHGKDGKTVLSRWVSFGDRWIPAAVEEATAIAGRTGDQAAVFAPPVAVFGDREETRGDGSTYRPASATNVVCAPAIAVELDERPSASLARLLEILGEPTIVVRSGGVWHGEAEKAEDKLHVYWRLAKPAVTAEERETLRKARAAATRLVDADLTGISVAHPMRWPGSWHTKTAAPRLCEIVGGDPDRDVQLDEAAARLMQAVEAAGLGVDGRSRRERAERRGFKTRHEWSAEALKDAADLLPNEGLSWDDWNRIGMAFKDASHDSLDGLDAFHAWSAKDARYDYDTCEARWSHWSSSPPSDLSGGTLARAIRQVVPTYRSPDVKAQVEEWYEKLPPDPADIGPVDIFGDADPAELGRVPDGALPPLIERWAQTEARRKGVPPAFAAAAAVSAVGAAISSAIRIQVKRNDPSYTEGSNLWTVLVADPGSAKSPIVSAAIEPLRHKDAEWAKSDLVRYAEWEKASKRKGKDAPPAGPEPRVRRRLVDDITWEKLVRCFAGNPRLLRAPDEFQGMLDSFGAYKNGGGGDRSQFLRTFDGGPITYDRVAAGTIYAESASLAVLAGTQPDKMREVAKNLGSDGLLQRCLFVLHDGLEHEAIDERPDASAVDSYRSMLTGFLAADYHFPPAIRMDDQAGELFASSWRQIRTLKNLPGVGPAFRGHVMKWEKILSRLVLIFHCVGQFETDGRIDPEEAVDVETVERAVRFGRFLLRHAVRFYEIYFGATDAASEARWIAGHLLTKPELTEVRRRDLYSARKTLQGPVGLRLLLTAMAELEGAGWCRVAGARDADGPVAWTIDERIHSRFAERGEREKRERAERQAKIMQAGSAKSWINGVEPEEAEEARGLVSAFD